MKYWRGRAEGRREAWRERYLSFLNTVAAHNTRLSTSSGHSEDNPHDARLSNISWCKTQRWAHALLFLLAAVLVFPWPLKPVVGEGPLKRCRPSGTSWLLQLYLPHDSPNTHWSTNPKETWPNGWAVLVCRLFSVKLTTLPRRILVHICQHFYPAVPLHHTYRSSIITPLRVLTML